MNQGSSRQKKLYEILLHFLVQRVLPLANQEPMGAGGCFLCSQNVYYLMFKKRQVPLTIHLIVILNNLGIIYL